MLTKTKKNLLVVMLCVIVALAMIFGIASFGGNKVLANADNSVVLLDLNKGHADNAGSGFAGGNTIMLHWATGSQSGTTWGGLNLKCGETALGDLIVLTTANKSQTVAKWKEENCITRVIIFGDMIGVNLEESGLAKSDVVSITYKSGLAPIINANGWGNNAANTGTADTTKALKEDITLYINYSNGDWEYESTALTVTTNPTKTEYLTGEDFSAEGMVIKATTVVAGEIELDISKLTYSYDFSTAGEKTVTVSYGGKTTTVEVEVEAPTKVLTDIAYKSGSVSIEQNGSINEMTIDSLKIMATYDNGSEEVDVTKDMISVDPAMLGKVKGKITYTFGRVTKTCEMDVTVTERTSKFTKDNLYLIPIDGYYTGENGGALTVSNNGINIWFTTNAGYGKYNMFEGLSEKWYSDSGFETAFADIKAHVLLNGKTFDQLNEEGAELARYVLGYYSEGLSLRVHTAGAFKAENLETVTLLKGFRLYNNSAQALGAPTPCDYTFEVVAKPGTNDTMLVRKTESVTVETAPQKTNYLTIDAFSTDGMTIKAVYSDGGVAVLPVKDRMVSYDFSEAGEKDVTVTYNGKTVTQKVNVTFPAVTVTGIAVKDGVTLSLKQYSLNAELSEGAKIVVSYSDNTTEENDLTLDMVSGYTNETVGNGTAIVTYQGYTCELNYTVSAYDGTSYFSSVKYTAIYGTEGTGYIELVGIDDINNAGVPLKALWTVDKAKSLVIGKTIGDFVTINGVTVTELVKQGKVARMIFFGKYFAFHIDDAAFMATVKNGAEICLLPGFTWVTNTADAWGVAPTPETYQPIENAVVTERMYFCLKDGNVCKVMESVTLNGTPKTEYCTGDVVDVTGLTLSVKYKGFDIENVDVTLDMCDYDFSEFGEKTVTISYNGGTASFDVSVINVWLTSITIETQPTKTIYDFAIDNEIDFAGLKVVATYSNDTTKEISIDSLGVEGFDSRKLGKQTVTLNYGGQSATFEIEVKNISDDKYLSIDYASAAPSYEATSHKSLVVYFTLNGTYEELSSFWGANKLDYVADYMLINGESVSELIKQGKVTRLAVWVNQLVIHLDTEQLVPSKWVDKYVEGVSEVVETITFLPGFQWYTVKGVLVDQLWGNDNAYLHATPIAGAVLKEKITIYNEDGYGWSRPLLKNDDGTISDDALTILSLPNKTSYVVGEKLELDGLEILAKYADGGEEIIVPGVSDIEGYHRNTEGTQTLQFSYFGKTVSFDITVSTLR